MLMDVRGMKTLLMTGRDGDDERDGYERGMMEKETMRDGDDERDGDNGRDGDDERDW